MFKIVIMYFIMYNIDFFPLNIILLKVTFLWFYFNYNNSRIVLILYFTDEADVYFRFLSCCMSSFFDEET